MNPLGVEWWGFEVALELVAMNGNRRVLITTPFPTPEEVATAIGLSPERHAEIKRMVDEIYAERMQPRVARRATPKRRQAKPAKKK